MRRFHVAALVFAGPAGAGANLVNQILAKRGDAGGTGHRGGEELVDAIVGDNVAKEFVNYGRDGRQAAETGEESGHALWCYCDSGHLIEAAQRLRYDVFSTEPGFGGNDRVFVGDGDNIVVAPPEEDALPSFGEYVYTDELPEKITHVQPVYPDIAREAGVDGTVMVQALVGKDGRVKEARVMKSIPMLDAAALAAVKQWVFKPALSNNKPVAVWVGCPVKFSLR